MASIAIGQQTNQKRWKRQFETSLNRIRGEETPVSQRPILHSKAEQGNTPRAAIAEAANYLAALWDISKPKRHER